MGENGTRAARPPYTLCAERGACCAGTVQPSRGGRCSSASHRAPMRWDGSPYAAALQNNRRSKTRMLVVVVRSGTRWRGQRSGCRGSVAWGEPGGGGICADFARMICMPLAAAAVAATSQRTVRGCAAEEPRAGVAGCRIGSCQHGRQAPCLRCGSGALQPPLPRTIRWSLPCAYACLAACVVHCHRACVAVTWAGADPASQWLSLDARYLVMAQVMHRSRGGGGSS